MEQWELNEYKKDYLKGYKAAKRAEELVLEEIQQLRLNEMFPCLQYSDMPRGNNCSDLSDYAVKMDELMEKLKKERLEGIQKYADIRKNIMIVKDDDEREVLMRHYLLGKSWESIADSMGCTTRNIHYIHGRALKKFVMPESFHCFSQ